MTGFGSKQYKGDSLNCEWSIRSVNHRSLNVDFYIPTAMQAADASFRRLLEKRIERGKIECHLKVQKKTKVAGEGLNQKVSEIAKKEKILSAKFPFAQSLSIYEIIKLLDTFDTNEELTLKDKKIIQEVFENALEELIINRIREGVSVQRKLISYSSKAALELNKLANQTPKISKQLIQKYKKSITLPEGSLKQDSYQRDLMNYANKIDVTEEIDRLSIHIKQIGLTLNKKDSIGKQIDFLCQEANREINTISSKLRESRVIDRVIKLKLYIERIREQIQNVE
jgi:uncharacterized protein (TIGR00255 family)